MSGVVHPGLRRKFFVALLIAGIVPGIAALLATYLYSTRILKHSIGSGFQEIARSTAIRIASAIDTEIDRAIRLAGVPIQVREQVKAANARYTGQRHPAGVAGPAASMAQTAGYLNAWARESGYYVGVTLADRQGALVASTDAGAAGPYASEAWWREAMGARPGSAYVSTIRYDSRLKDYLFDVAVPVFDDPPAGPIGAIGLVVRREVLVNTILPIRIGETGHGMLLDTEGTPLICPVLPPTAHLIHDALLKQLARDQPLWLVAEDDAHGGHQSLVAAAPVTFTHPLTPGSLGTHRWFSFIRQHPDETYAPVYSLLLTVGLIGFGLVIALASAGVLVGRRIVDPILTLRNEADALRRDVTGAADEAVPPAAGTPLEAFPIRTGDEIEDLARTFQAMRLTLLDSLRTIRAQQEELIRREKLASVGQLLAALAHDLRNPLGVIRTSAQLVLDTTQADTVRQEVARYIVEEVDRLTHRINDFLRYARQKPPEPRAVDLHAIVETALRQWRAQGGHERIELVTRAEEGLPEALVDPDQITEALVNLLINAREAMPDGGRLTLATRRDRESVELSVTDTGPGIKPEELLRIFEPFFTTKEYGTGLGLTNVRRLVQDNGGIVEVYSEPGKGTRFIVRFPAAPANEG